MSRRLRHVAAGLTVLGTCILVSCATAASQGPLVFGDGSSRALCVNPLPGETYLVGEVLEAPLDTELVIERVSLIDAVSISLVEASVVRIVNETAIGSLSRAPSTLKQWRERDDAAGHTLVGGESANLVVVIKRSGTSAGRAAALQVDYLAGDTHYSKRGSQSIAVADHC